MKDIKESKVIIFTVQIIVALIASGIIIFLDFRSSDAEYLYLLISIFILNSITIIIYCFDDTKKANNQ